MDLKVSLGHPIGMGPRAPVLDRFGARVKELRMSRGLSQEAFAEDCGFDRTYVSGIERGVRNVSLVNIERLAQTLGVSLSQLMQNL